MKTFTGTVIRTNTAKTAHVEVARLWMHPVYRKKVKVTKNFACHDEIGVHVGDVVLFAETRPISATKHFKIMEVVRQGSIIDIEKVEKQEAKPKKETKKKEKKITETKEK